MVFTVNILGSMITENVKSTDIYANAHEEYLRQGGHSFVELKFQEFPRDSRRFLVIFPDEISF